MASLYTETGRFKWPGHKNEVCSFRNTPLNTMISPNVDASLAANGVRENAVACKREEEKHSKKNGDQQMRKMEQPGSAKIQLMSRKTNSLALFRLLGNISIYLLNSTKSVSKKTTLIRRGDFFSAFCAESPVVLSYLLTFAMICWVGFGHISILIKRDKAEQGNCYISTVMDRQ